MHFDSWFQHKALIAFAAALLASGAAHAQAQAQPQDQPVVGADETVTLNFVNADIQAVIKAVGEMTGRNFLIDPRVQGTVNIVAPKPVPRALVFPILLSALRVHGFAAAGGDLGFVNIVPESDAKFYAGLRDPRRARGDQIMTEVFQLRHESATQLVPILRPLVAPNNVINAFPASNTIVVTDYASNIERVRKVIVSVDQPSPSELITLTPRYAAAVDVGQAIQRLLPETVQATQPGAPPRVAVGVDSRTNSLLIRAENPQLAKRIQELAASMDLPTAAGGNIHVIYLKNAEATRLAEALRAIVTGQPIQRSAAPPPPGPTGAPPPPPGAQPVAAGAPAGVGGGAPATGALANVSIQAYPETNSLVVIAPDAAYQGLRGVIEKLDARRAQVFVEALIVEMTASKAAQFGVQWQALSNGDTNATRAIGGTNFNISASGANTSIIGAAADITTLGPGLNIGVIKGRITINGRDILNLAALVEALDQDTTANILSTPTLLTLDNEEAKIQVGQNVPIVTGAFTLAGAGAGATNPFQTFERRDIGVTLKIRPQIAEGGVIKMALYEEVSSIFNANNPSGIILNKRSLESQVLVDDGQIVVLGGLIADDVETSTQQVPVLGQLPILGYLFRFDTRTRQKTNLMVFLRPVVLRDAKAAATLTGDRYDIIRGTQGLVQTPDRFPLPSMRGPLLPPQLPPLLPNQPSVPERSGEPSAATPANPADSARNVPASQQ